LGITLVARMALKASGNGGAQHLPHKGADRALPRRQEEQCHIPPESPRAQLCWFARDGFLGLEPQEFRRSVIGQWCQLLTYRCSRTRSVEAVVSFLIFDRSEELRIPDAADDQLVDVLEPLFPRLRRPRTPSRWGQAHVDMMVKAAEELPAIRTEMTPMRQRSSRQLTVLRSICVDDAVLSSGGALKVLQRCRSRARACVG
jgi:hypothetical protein